MISIATANPKYTFLLPAFKGRFLDEMLRSIQGQTYRDFKVIISDDCSPEDLRSICEPYLADPRFTYRRNAENMGSKSLVSHWNMLVDMCDTEFLILASDDDVYEPQFLEEIDRLTVKYPDVDLFRARVKVIDDEGDTLRKDILLEEYHSQIEFLYYFYCIGIQKCVAHYAFRSSALKAKGGFYDLPLAWGSDDATGAMLSENGVCHTPSLCFSFRNSGINISSTGGQKVMSEKTREIYIYIRFLEVFLPKVKQSIKSKLEKNMYGSIENSIRSGFYVQNLFWGAEFASYKEMMTYYRFLSEKGLFKGRLDKIHYLWTWLRAYKSRKS